MRPCGKQFGDNCCLKSFSYQSESGPKASATGANHYGIVGVVDHRVLLGDGVRSRRRSTPFCRDMKAPRRMLKHIYGYRACNGTVWCEK